MSESKSDMPRDGVSGRPTISAYDQIPQKRNTRKSRVGVSGRPINPNDYQSPIKQDSENYSNEVTERFTARKNYQSPSKPKTQSFSNEVAERNKTSTTYIGPERPFNKKSSDGVPENFKPVGNDKNPLKPDIKTEKKFSYLQSNIIFDEVENKLFSVCDTSLEQLGDYGVSLQLYFLAIKQIGFLFLLISLVSVWPMLENYFGAGLDDWENSEPWDVFTLANQYTYNTTMIETNPENQVLSFKNSKFRIVIADLLYTLLFFFAVIYFKINSDKAIDDNRNYRPTTADYSIEVSGLPENCTKSDVFEIFEKKIGKVCEVYLARRYHKVLELYKSRAELNAKKKYYKEIGSNLWENNKKITELEEDIKSIDNSIKNKLTETKMHDELPVITAFIIFNDLEDKITCLNVYGSGSWRGLCKPALKFKGYKLTISNTSDPSNINWENLEYSWLKRSFRSIFSLISVLFVLILSIVIIFVIHSFNENLPTKRACTIEYQINSELSLSEAKSIYTSDTQKYCYCRGQTINEILSYSALKTFRSYYLEKRSIDISIRVLVCFTVVMVNFFLKFVFKFLSGFEIVASKSKELIKVMIKVFLAWFINTALVILFVNADFSSNSLINKLPYSSYIFNSQYSDFTRMWYVTVGSTITITMLVSMLSPLIVNIFMSYTIDACKRHYRISRCRTEQELNNVFTGPDFDIAIRYSKILNVIFTSFLYSGGIPLLNCTCCVTMFLMYWTDKFSVLRHYSKPPRYSSELNSEFLKILPFAGIIHCGFSLYMVGAEDIFPESFYVQDGFLYANHNSVVDRVHSVFGIMYLVVIAVGVFVYIYLLGAYVCKNDGESRIADVENRSFEKKKDRIREFGLNTYDILKNPEYRDLVESMNNSVKKLRKTISDDIMDNNSDIMSQSRRFQ